MSTGELFQEVYLCSEHNSLPAGVRLGPVLFAPVLLSVDPCTGELQGQGLEAQLRGAFENMDRFLKAAGAGREHVARVTVFMTDLSERQLLNVVWSELYPDSNDRPPHKYVPSTLPEGALAAVQVLALLGASRRVLEVPGLVHQDPMSMGALTGNLVTSSRVFAGRRVEDADEHTSILFESVSTLLQQAGGDLTNLTQITAFIGEPRYRDNVEKAWRQIAGESKDAPELHILETNLGGGGAPRVEILALI
jgi:2-iminobutanoate/2-iminopropanoate deaminase